jgi:predicted permease
LVVSQIALSLVLLIGAALMIQTLARLRDVDSGFNTSNLLTMKLALPPGRYDTNQKKTAFFADLLERVRGVPGVVGATVSLSLPTRVGLFTNVAITGQPEVEPSKQPQARLQSVTPGYFEALGIKLRQGRTFNERDSSTGAPPSIVVNESFARRFWPGYPNGVSPVGQRMFEGADLVTADIVGVVADVLERGPAFEPEPQFYVPINIHPPQTAFLVVRTALAPLDRVNGIRSQVMAVDRDQPISDVQTMEDTLSASVGERQLMTLLLGSFAGISLVLAGVGIYGVIAYLVLQRTREIGIRMALGAQKFQVLKDILRHALLLALLGVGLGIAGAFALTRFATALLFQVSPTDPMTFLLLSLLFIFLALAASYIPARRATKVDPIDSLRFSN